MKVLLADDHEVFRQGLKHVLTRRFGKVTFGEAETAQKALDQVWKQPWDVMILDITMPGRSGVEILRQIKQAQPKLPVLVLSAHPEDQYALRVLQAGAAGYVTKISASTELVQAIEKVLAGGTYLTESVSQSLVEQLKYGVDRRPHERLSHREYEILRLLASGKPAKAIAHDLAVSVQTVSTHRARMLKKLGMHSTAELIRYAIKHDLAD